VQSQRALPVLAVHLPDSDKLWLRSPTNLTQIPSSELHLYRKVVYTLRVQPFCFLGICRYPQDIPTTLKCLSQKISELISSGTTYLYVQLPPYFKYLYISVVHLPDKFCSSPTILPQAPSSKLCLYRKICQTLNFSL
jgi:hypothetical protein